MQLTQQLWYVDKRFSYYNLWHTFHKMDINPIFRSGSLSWNQCIEIFIISQNRFQYIRFAAFWKIRSQKKKKFSYFFFFHNVYNILCSWRGRLCVRTFYHHTNTFQVKEKIVLLIWKWVMFTFLRCSFFYFGKQLRKVFRKK